MIWLSSSLAGNAAWLAIEYLSSLPPGDIARLSILEVPAVSFLDARFLSLLTPPPLG